MNTIAEIVRLLNTLNGDLLVNALETVADHPDLSPDTESAVALAFAIAGLTWRGVGWVNSARAKRGWASFEDASVMATQFADDNRCVDALTYLRLGRRLPVADVRLLPYCLAIRLQVITAAATKADIPVFDPDTMRIMSVEEVRDSAWAEMLPEIEWVMTTIRGTGEAPAVARLVFATSQKCLALHAACAQSLALLALALDPSVEAAATTERVAESKLAE